MTPARTSDRPRSAWPFPTGARFSYVGKCISARREYRFRLTAGDYEIAYSLDAFDHEPAASSGAIATLVRDAVDLGPVRLELPRLAHIPGRVVDHGMPVAGVDVAACWHAFMGESKPTRGACTDVNGRFALTLALYDDSRPRALLALDRPRERAGVIVWKPDAKDPLTIELEPAVRLHGNFSLDGAMPPPTFSSTAFIEALPDQSAISFQRQHGAFEFRLPAGRYRFVGYGGDVIGGWETKQVTRDLEFAKEPRDVDLGSVALPLPSTAIAAGKPAPPLTVTDARGVDRGITLADLKGKWVLLEFWGFW